MRKTASFLAVTSVVIANAVKQSLSALRINFTSFVNNYYVYGEDCFVPRSDECRHCERSEAISRVCILFRRCTPRNDVDIEKKVNS